MSERRTLRLTLTAALVITGAATALAATGWFDGTDGALAFPLMAVAALTGLITIRPTTTKGK